MKVLRCFHPRIAVESSRTETKLLGIFVLTLDDGRATPPAKYPMISRRRFPFLEELCAGDQAKRRGWNCRATGKCRARHLAAEAAMTVGHSAELAVTFVFYAA